MSNPNLRSMIRVLSVLALFPLFLACGGGGSGGSASGGIGGSGVSQGSIDGFGSIFVNGVRWDTQSANITIDDDPASESDLELGMVVTIEGNFGSSSSTGTATSVRGVDDLEGPISSVTPIGDGSVIEIVVLGVTVEVDSLSTVFDDESNQNFSFANMMVNDVVEVSGLRAGPNRIVATRLEKQRVFTPGMGVAAELEGTISSLNIGASTFQLGSILVRFNMMTDVSELGGTPLSNGLRVEVEGTFDGTEFAATEIEPEDDDLPDAARVELEGVVSNFVGIGDFEVGGQPVDASGATVDGDVALLENGVEVEVEGRIEMGILIADMLEIDDERFRVAATIAQDTDVDPVNGTIGLLGGAIIVEVDASTRLEDDRDEVDDFGIEDLRGGDFIEVRGARSGTNRIRANELERDDIDDIELQGVVDSVSAGTRIVEILGFRIATDGNTDYETTTGPVSETVFFNTVRAGDVVKAQDDRDGNDSLFDIADELEIEDD